MPTNILISINGNVLVAHENLFVQVRRGELRERDFAALASHVRRVTQCKGAVGFLAVVEEGAATVSDEVRAKQKEFFASLLERADVRVGTVILGDDVASTMRRTMARLTVPGRSRLRVTGSIAEAVAFVAPHVGLSAAVVEGVVRDARAAAKP